MCARTASRQPGDLKGKKVGVAEYQLTANVWARALLEDEFGVKPSDIHWVRGGLEEPGRLEKIPIKLPPDVRLENAPEGATLSAMLAAGTIDAFIGPRVPSCFERGHPDVGWLFPDPTARRRNTITRTGIFPIMHIVGVRRSLVDQHPWLPAAVLKAFEQAKAMALARLRDTSATKVTMPFVEEQLKRVRELMGPDYWSYGVPPIAKCWTPSCTITTRKGCRRAASRSMSCSTRQPSSRSSSNPAKHLRGHFGNRNPRSGHLIAGRTSVRPRTYRAGASHR